MAHGAPGPSDLPLLEQAASWFDRRSSGALSREDAAEFERWRQASPAHQLAFAEIEATHAQARAAANSNEMLALRHEALARRVMPTHGRGRWVAAAGAIAACLLVVVGVNNWGQLTDFGARPAQIAANSPTIYRTAVGERLTVMLPDGSSATLNTASRLRLAYGSTARRLILEQGQVLFRVAKHRDRPFTVQALDRIVTAHGTVFDVRIARDDQVKVALLEGSVSVASTSAPAAPVTELQPKEVLVATNDRVLVSREPQIEKEVSWRDGLIIFEDETLADAASEMNRYLRTPIVLRDEKVRQIRVSGAFRTGETAAFVEALQLSFPVRVVERNSSRIVLAYRS